VKIELSNTDWFIFDEKTLLFQKGPLSQWWGGFKDQEGGFLFLEHQFNCAEQFMMASKAAIFDDEESIIKILHEKNPKIQKEIGRGIAGFDPVEWDAKKRQVVFTGNLQKFWQNPELREILLETGDREIAEAAPWDKVWGTGTEFSTKSLDKSTWVGENLLGRALMAVRQTLQYTHGP
jgi:ribA/ribD-fused uncharacterized protein